MQGTFADFAAIYTRRYVWLLMGAQDITIRYRRSVIGPFWISLTMAFFVLSLSFVYAEIFKLPFRGYLSYLACGMLAWNFLSGMIIEGAGIVAEGEAHLRNVALPISVLSARMVYRNALIFGHNFVAIIFLLVVFGHTLTWVSILMIGGFAFIVAFGLFAGIILGPLCARYRDVPQVITNVMQMLFFVTPIIWMPSAAAHRPQLVNFNPLNDMLSLVRQPLLGEVPEMRHVVVAAGVVAAMGVLAFLTTAFTRKRIFLWL